MFNFKAGDQVSLRSAAKTFITSKTLPTAGSITAPGSAIGTARIRSLVLDSGTPGTAACRYRMYLFDITMNAGSSFRDTRAVYYDGTNQDGIADVVLTYDATSTTNIAKLIDSSFDRLVFPVSSRGVKSITNITYNYRTVTNELTLSTAGNFSIGPLGSGLTLPIVTGKQIGRAHV